VSRRLEWLIALLIGATGLGVAYARAPASPTAWDQYRLPAFDAYAYVAMAEAPRFFTVPPWGYRVLTAWLVWAVPGLSASDAYPVVTGASLLASAGLLFLLLRRMGHRRAQGFLGVAAFALSSPVAQVVEYPYLVEPVTVMLMLAFLLALEAREGIGVAVLLATLGALSKEIFVALVPLTLLVRYRRTGLAKAALETLVVGAPVVLATTLLRSRWSPGLPPAMPRLDAERVSALAGLVTASPELWLSALLVGGLGPLAAFGALRARGRSVLLRYGWLLVVAFVLPLVTPYDFAVPHLAAEMPRFAVYALPLLLSLALHALDFGRAVPEPPSVVRPRGRREALFLAGSLLVALSPLVIADPYRRVGLEGSRDGGLVLALARQSLATADRLEKGLFVWVDLDHGGYRPRVMEPHYLDNMRWFLREGWGPSPHYSLGEVRMHDPRAVILLPCLKPLDLLLTLVLSAPVDTQLRVSVNGSSVGSVTIGAERRGHLFKVPASLLFRGDNQLVLEVESEGRPRLHEFALGGGPRAHSHVK
jgi:hypothetical protein